jgi:hypothetical protein
VLYGILTLQLNQDPGCSICQNAGGGYHQMAKHGPTGHVSADSFANMIIIIHGIEE